jgi:hypothetical protein
MLMSQEGLKSMEKNVKFWNNITTDLTITGCEYMDWIILARVNV